MTRSLHKQIAAIALPAIVINITTPLLSIADVAIAGHLSGSYSIAAIAIGSTAFNLLYWLFGFLRMGTSGLTAQAHGAEAPRICLTVALRSLSLALGIGLLLALFGSPICLLIMKVLDATGATLTAATDYFNICIWGAPAVLGTFALTGWFVGMQNTRIPMCVSLIIDIFNILLSLILALPFGLGITGIAIGTLSAQWLGFALLAAMHLRLRYRLLNAPQRDVDTQINRHFGIKNLIKINTDIFLRTLCLVAVTLWFTRVGAMQGPQMLAVNAMLMQLFTLFSYFTDGLAFAAEAICGKQSGKADTVMLSLSIRTFIRIGLYGAILFSGIYLLLGDDFLSLLTDDTSVIAAASSYTLWAAFIPIAGFLGFVWDGICIGLTHTRAMLLTMIIATTLFFITFTVAFPSLENHALWLAFTLYLLTRGISLTLLHRKLI